MMSARPEVSICLITYAHERFVRRAIDGVLAQRTDFDWEFIIAEDFSPDATRAIVEEYGSRYPEKIRLILPPANTRAKVWVDLMRAARGHFVAYLDGDDYWTATDKLQRQRDFLVANNDCAMVAHNMRVLDDATGRLMGDTPPPGQRSRYSLDDLAEFGTIFRNSSVMYRAEALPSDGPDASVMQVGDWLLHLDAARHGLVGYLDEVMGVYRRANSSQSASNRNKPDIVCRDLLYTLSEAKRFGASAGALARGRARVHFDIAMGSLLVRNYAVFRREMAESLVDRHYVSRAHRALAALRFVPTVARQLLQGYQRIAGK
jgi:glycosyltransferase involved in cell wall biosynthesis